MVKIAKKLVTPINMMIPTPNEINIDLWLVKPTTSYIYVNQELLAIESGSDINSIKGKIDATPTTSNTPIINIATNNLANR